MSARIRPSNGSDLILVGDVGGTNARYAVIDISKDRWLVEHKLDLVEQFPDFVDSIRAYLDRAGLPDFPAAAAIAVAGPVTRGSVTFTNRGWHASEDQLKSLGFRDALLINDFAALAFSVSRLQAHDSRAIGPELQGIAGEPISILGAGTGFGASLLARYRGRSIAVATEGGHMGFSPGNAQELEVMRVLMRRFEHVSVERVLSGPGLENLHAAIAEIAGRSAPRLAAAEIVASAGRGDADGRDALAMFCDIYGGVAGDFALAHGARGGVFLAGGIAAKIETILDHSAFRARFEAKGRLSHYVKPIPTRLVVNPDATFLGAAVASLEFRGT